MQVRAAYVLYQERPFHSDGPGPPIQQTFARSESRFHQASGRHPHRTTRRAAFPSRGGEVFLLHASSDRELPHQSPPGGHNTILWEGSCGEGAGPHSFLGEENDHEDRSEESEEPLRAQGELLRPILRVPPNNGGGPSPSQETAPLLIILAGFYY